MSRHSKLKRIRFDLGLTLDQVFVKSRRRLQPSRVSKLERGILLPDESDRKILSRIYGVPEKDLFD